jgi:hypothetical protein
MQKLLTTIPPSRPPDTSITDAKIVMSRPWNASLYHTHDAQSPPPDPRTAQSLMKAVHDDSEKLQKHPYDTLIRTDRAECYLQLNYPELAASDAYKAILLLDREANGGDDTNRVKANNILSQALYDCHCHWELVEFWQDVVAKHPSEYANEKLRNIEKLMERKTVAAGPFTETTPERKERLRDGGVVTVGYPWLPEQHLVRSQELVEAVNLELTEGNGQRACYLAQSTLASDSDVLGMFAARDIRPGECILVDRTATAACSNPGPDCCSNCFAPIPGPPIHTSCCLALYCSTNCRDLALSTYHRVLCGQDFSWLQSPACKLTHNASQLRPLIMLRFIAASIQSGTHPLSHPLIARLQPLADRNHVDVFTFTESIVTPMKVLQQLGIDVFTNPQFDTMVLHTVWCRLANNKAGSYDPLRGFVDEITPHLPLFNHSCDPNVEWRREDGSTTISFYVKRKVKKDEELFSSYVNTAGMGLEERTDGLWPWFEGECLCEKCTRERAALA